MCLLSWSGECSIIWKSDRFNQFLIDRHWVGSSLLQSILQWIALYIDGKAHLYMGNLYASFLHRNLLRCLDENGRQFLLPSRPVPVYFQQISLIPQVPPNGNWICPGLFHYTIFSPTWWRSTSLPLFPLNQPRKPWSPILPPLPPHSLFGIVPWHLLLMAIPISTISVPWGAGLCLILKERKSNWWPFSERI